MKITCLITVCVYLLSTVSTDEIQHLNRQRRVKGREKSVLDDATARKELNPNIRPDVFSTLRKSRLQGQIETFQKPYQKKVHKPQPQQQQPFRDRSRRPVKRLKVRSIAGSTYEVHDNEVHEIIHEPIPEVHDKGPIYIKPVVRVTKKNIFDSIIDILNQLLEPPKKELGPIVGPIKMPGSKRKIYLRLLEPVDSSHINVRFVTQVPVPVVDEESILSREHETILPFLSYADPEITLLNRHPIASSDATFSSSNRHRTVQLPRNASRVSGKGRGSQPKPATKLKRPSENLKETDKENVPVKVQAASGVESDKNHLYYQYQSADDAVKQVTEIIKDATENEQDSKDSLEPWYQLSTHRLPLRQIAPLYPLSTMEHTDSENTYKVPSDNLTVLSPHSSLYEQYSNVNAEAPFYDQSSYSIPNTYVTTYQKQNEFSNAPSSYPISYQNQNQNEFNNAPSSTSYVKQNDLFSAPTVHTSSYEKPANAPPPLSSYVTSHKAQNDILTDSSSQNALRVIDPPLYFLDPRKVSGNHANQILDHTAIQQQPYNLPNANEIGSRNTAKNSELPIDQVTWGKVKREKSETDFQKSGSNFPKGESNFQKSVEITSDDNREKWQPFVPEDADWHKAYASLAKVANGNHHETATSTRQQSVNHPRQLSRYATTSESTSRAQRQSSKRRNHSVASTRNSRCSTLDKGDGSRCERTEATIVSTLRPEDTVKIKEQTQLAGNIEPIVITPKSVASNTVEMSRLNVITKSSWIEEPQPLVMTTETPVTSSTTERPPLLIKMIQTETTEKSIENKTTYGPMNNVTEKSAASNMTERSSISGTSKASTPQSNTTKRLYLPKRPMIMKKQIFVLNEMESSSTTKRTVANSTMRKPTMSTTTEKTKTMRRSKFREGVISKMKSSST